MTDQLNIEKAVNDAVTRAEDDHRRAVTVGGAISAEEVRAEATAEFGSGWSLAAIFRRLRRTQSNEGGIRVTKEF